MLCFLLFNLCSLKQQSTKMTKRQSFMMEAKPIDTKKTKKELSNLQSKQTNVHNKLFES